MHGRTEMRCGSSGCVLRWFRQNALINGSETGQNTGRMLAEMDENSNISLL